MSLSFFWMGSGSDFVKDYCWGVRCWLGWSGLVWIEMGGFGDFGFKDE